MNSVTLQLGNWFDAHADPDTFVDRWEGTDSLLGATRKQSSMHSNNNSCQGSSSCGGWKTRFDWGIGQGRSCCRNRIKYIGPFSTAECRPWIDLHSPCQWIQCAQWWSPFWGLCGRWCQCVEPGHQVWSEALVGGSGGTKGLSHQCYYSQKAHQQSGLLWICWCGKFPTQQLCFLLFHIFLLCSFSNYTLRNLQANTIAGSQWSHVHLASGCRVDILLKCSVTSNL